MIVKVLFGQRICSYPGEYAPEALAVATEYDYDDYPDYLDKEERTYKASEEFSSIVVVDIGINQDELESILSPKTQRISGKIQK